MTSHNPKFMQTLKPKHYRILEEQAKTRGVTVQQLLRSIVIPDWMSRNGLLKPVPVTEAGGDR